ncbi:GNAT family N-acetyltransferase [Saccharicrinis sp. FJH54]|uniref:GNAT family N-acetyltransferase n=1 Tax=Saccharicrinis sp. FJH54 TaxID=3344665 RepID=UPI0035D45B21
MIRFLKRKDIDDSKWDALVAHSWHETSYGYCWYLDRVTSEWHGLVLDDYSAVMPLATSVKFGIPYVLNVPFMQYTTVYGTRPDPGLFRRFMEAVPDRFRFLDFKVFLPFEPQLDNAEVTSHTNLVLDLNNPLSDLKTGFNTNTKRNLKKADRQNITVRSMVDPEPLLETYRQFKLRKYNSKFDDLLKGRIRDIIHYGVENGLGDLVYAYDSDNRYLGGTYFQKSGSRFIYLFSAAEETAQKTGAMAFIVWKQIEKNAGKRKILDFEGSDIEGIARFYKGFGSTEEKYYHIKINRLPRIIKWIKD